ncbi:MAG: M28 family peptidase [Anaerolineales bacterium]|jgi:hypothetical protein|nr:M28 family peptidase [Anaerolineales bacterium]
MKNQAAQTVSLKQWSGRALEYASALAAAFPGRGSATKAETAAAEHVRRQLTSLGVADVRCHAFQGQRSIWLFLAQAFGLALVGHAAVWLLAPPLGIMAAVLVSVIFFALSFLQLWRKFTFPLLPARTAQNSQLSQAAATALPSGASQNILAVIPPIAAVDRRVVLLAHLDSHRAVWLFAHPLIVRVYSFLSPLALYGVLIAPLFYAFGLLAGIPVLSWLALLLGGIHFIAWFTGVTADLGPYSPGANDNASAVGSLLALAERLQAEPLAHTEVWLVFTGCEESGGEGMLHFLAEYRETLRDALFINLELVGIGDRLVYLENEGMLRIRTIPPVVRDLVQNTAQGMAARSAEGEACGSPPIIQAAKGALRGVFTEMNIAWEHGFRGVCLMVESSVEGSLPYWHRLTDVCGNYQESAFACTHAFVWELLQEKSEAKG